jgi:hypothetical protein
MPEAMTGLVRDGLYRHYKGMMYRAIDIVHHSETQEALVLYEALYENKTGNFWVRPAEMFLESVVIDGVTRPRFEYVGPASPRT